MNTKQFNGNQFNAVGSKRILRALVTNFWDVIFICPPVVTYIAPQNRTSTIAPTLTAFITKSCVDLGERVFVIPATPITIITNDTPEAGSPWQ